MYASSNQSFFHLGKWCVYSACVCLCVCMYMCVCVCVFVCMCMCGVCVCVSVVLNGVGCNVVCVHACLPAFECLCLRDPFSLCSYLCMKEGRLDPNTAVT